MQYYNNQNVPIDTAFVKTDGSFVFDDATDLESGIYRMNGIAKGFDFVIDKSQKFSFSVNVSDIVGTIQFKNSPENTLLFDYQRDFMPDTI